MLFPKKSLKILQLLFSLIIFTVSCGAKALTETTWLMQAPAKITIYIPNSVNPPDLKKIFLEAENLAALFDYRQASNALAQLNQKGEACLPPPLFSLITKSLEIAEKTEGAFDPTVLALMKLWDFEHGGRLPTQNEIEEALIKTGYQNIVLKDSLQVKLKNKAQIDLSGIGQGAVADFLADRLKQEGLQDFLIDISGDLILQGLKERSQPWRIAIRAPRASGMDINSENFSSAQLGFLGIVEIGEAGKRLALVTSGDYENRFVKDGVFYHHLLDPKTGFPARGVASATVLAPSCSEADALATAAVVLGFEKGLALLEKLPQVEGLLVREVNGQIEWKATSGFPKLYPKKD